MVFREIEKIRRRELAKIAAKVFAAERRERGRNRRLQEPEIADAKRSAVAFDLIGGDRENVVDG